MEKKLNILLIEDDTSLGSITSEYLVARGFNCLWEQNGELGYKSFVKNKYDIVILDVMMPVKDGFSTASDIRGIDKEIPIIFLTAKSMKEDTLKGFELGADDYVTKPFSVRELILRVKVLLKKRSDDIDQNLLEFGPIAMNLDAHDVSVEGKNILLTALEFKLLKHLLKRKGRVQTRDQLLGDVWGYSSEVTTRTVDTHIKRLREKLGKPGELIQTIRGVGYRFNN